MSRASHRIPLFISGTSRARTPDRAWHNFANTHAMTFGNSVPPTICVHAIHSIEYVTRFASHTTLHLRYIACPYARQSMAQFRKHSCYDIWQFCATHHMCARHTLDRVCHALRIAYHSSSQVHRVPVRQTEHGTISQTLML